jgi:hypothetical protein
VNWFLTAVLCIVLTELAIRLPFAGAVARVSRSGGRAVRVIRAKAASDHWKEKALAAYAQTTFLSSIKLAGLLVILIAVAAVTIVAFEYSSNGFQSFILSWRGIGSSVIFAALYFTVRKSILHGRV